MRRIMEKKAAGMKAKERILAALLSTALLLSAMPPVSAMAKNPAAPVEGQIQSFAAQPGGQTPVLTDVSETIPETADNAAQSCICQTQCIPAAGETPAVIDSVCPVCAPDGADLDDCLGKPANRSLGDPKTSTTLAVTFGSNGSGGESITDNDMKNAVEAALNQAGGKKPDFTTIQLTGDAAEITGWNWKYLINLYMENSDWSGLTTLDLSGMGSLTNVKNEKLSYKTIFQLTSVNFPSSLTTIGAYAFYDCTGLTSVSLPKGLTTIGDHAFASCTGIAGMMFPESIQTIKPGAFDSGSGLLKFEVNDNNLYFTTKDGVLYDKAKTTLLFYPPGRSGDFTVPDGVTAIEDRAFASCRLSGVNFPEGLQTIGEFAFSSSRALKKTTFPDSLQTIGGRAFLDCTGLKEITFPENLQIIGESAFYDCTSLSSLDFLGDAPPIVGDYAFYNVGSTGVIYYPEGANGYMDTWKNGIGLGSGWMLQPTTLTVLFDSNGNGGNSLDDNEMKTAVEAALVLARMDKTKITTIKLTGSARQITNHNWMYLRGLHTADSGWDHLISLDLSEMGSLIQVDAAGYSKYAATKFTSAAFPSSLQTIGEHAFQNCGELISVTFPADAQLKTIGDDAFASCAGLTSVSFPKGLQTIGKSAFASCAGLTNVSLPESLQTIGDNAFFSCTGLEAFEVDTNNPNFSSKDGVLYKAKSTLLQYPIAKSGTAFTVPDEVSAIGDSAFASCGDLTGVSFPEGLKTIGESAFCYCVSLSYLLFLGDTPPIVGSYAFDNVAPAGVIYYPAGANMYTDAWKKSISLGSGWMLQSDTLTVTFDSNGSGGTNITNNEMKTAVEAALALVGVDKTKITTIKLTGSATQITDSNWEYLLYLYSEDSEWSSLTTLDLSGMGSFTTVEAGININFLLTKLVELRFPDSLKTIGRNAFVACYNLTKLSFPEGLQTIESSAFNGCDGLTKLSFPESLQTIGFSAFQGCDGLESVSFPENLKTIGSSAFQSCSSLESVSFPANAKLETIENNTFTNCVSLTDVSFPEGLKIIGIFAFNGCAGLTSVSFPANLQTIGNYAFASCTGLTSVSFPEGLETIEAQSFSNCGSLKAFEVETDNLHFLSKDGVLYNKVNNTLLQYPIAKSGTSFNVPDGVTAIGDYAFDSCGNLTSVSFPESLQTIGNNAFASCGSLTSVSFPESLQTIGSSVFKSCASLTSVRFPESLQSIGFSAFESCTSLTSVIFPANAQLQTIGASAFASCSSLEEITFPASLSAIGVETFAYCGNLSSLTFLRDAPAFSHFSAFTGIASAGVIYYPAGSEKYTEAWKKDKLVLGPDWKLAPAYRLKVEHGAGDGTYGADVRVTVKADTPPSGQVFDKWVSSGGRFDNANSATTTFIMPAAHATVTATYKDDTPPPGHTHFFDSAWRYDNNNHWHECTAGDGARADEAAHTASEWITDKAAAKTEAGSRHKECTVCHYVMQTESIAPTGPTDITVDGAPFTVTINESTIPQTGDTANPLPWLLAMLAALTGGAALLLYRKCRCTKRRG